LLCTSYGEYKAARTCADLKRGALTGFFIPLRKQLFQQKMHFYKIKYINARVNLHFSTLRLWYIDGNIGVSSWHPGAMNGPVAKDNKTFFLTDIDWVFSKNLVFLKKNRARHLKQYLFFVSTQHFPLFVSIMLHWSIEDNLTLYFY
jgi:hypothetical protein